MAVNTGLSLRKEDHEVFLIKLVRWFHSVLPLLFGCPGYTVLVYAVLILFYASFLLWLPSLTRFVGGGVVGGGWWGLRKDFDTGLLCLVVKTICPIQPFTGFPARFLSCKIVKKLPLNFPTLFLPSLFLL
jgi:hypothetical protein